MVGNHEVAMKTDKPTSHALRNKKKSEKFDEVDKRIQIPMATQMKMQMNRKMNANSSDSSSNDTRLLRTGIDQYRTLQHLNDARRSRGSAERAAERGLSLVERKQFGAAVSYLTEALETLLLSSSDWNTTSSTVKLYHERGVCFLATKKYKAAIDDFSRVMQMTPKSADLYAKRGKAYAALGEPHAALLDYSEAISLASTQGLLHDHHTMATRNDGQSSSAGLVKLRGLYLARAKVYKTMNNITHALEDLCHAENSAGGHRDAELYYDRAHLYLQCHQDPLALQDFDRFLELQEEAEESRHFDASGGIGGLAGFVTPQESTAEVTARVLDVLLERGRLLQRLALEEDARERKDAELAAIEQGQITTKHCEAKRAYTTVLPKPEPYRGIESRRLEKRALQDYTRALDLEGRNVEALRLRGEALMHLGRYEDALSDLTCALEVDPQDFEVAMARARLYRQRGDLKLAVDEVTAVLQGNGFFVNGLKMRAQLYEELGLIHEAENDYSSIIHAHFDNSEMDEPAATGKVTMHFASGGTLQVNSSRKGKGGRGGSSGKITSEVAAHALLCRARLRLASEQFNAAEEDYQAILNSFANNMEAQLELQETRERRLVFEQQKLHEALAWLEQNADEKDGAVASNLNGNTSTSKNKKRKKKKKKKAANSSAFANAKDKLSVGYVLLEDEEERQENEEHNRLQVIQEKKLKPKEVCVDNKDTDIVSTEGRHLIATITSLDFEQAEQKAKMEKIGTLEINERLSTNFDTAEWLNTNMIADKSDEELRSSSTELARGNPPALSMRRDAKGAVSTIIPPPVVVANVMSRDEAWESMCDEDAGETLETGAVRIEIQAHSDDFGQGETEHEALTVADNSVSINETSCRVMHEDQSPCRIVRPTPCTFDKETNEEASGSSEDGKDDHSKAKAVLMDEKYLKKRERQLKKLRASLQRASDECDTSAINEALARAERKQMSDALQEDVQRARNVLADMAIEMQRLRDVLPYNEALSSSKVISERNRKHLHSATAPSSAISDTAKPSSLTIRPIAYGQALQAAEQQQQEVKTYQKVLEEKDAEIAKLQRLLAQNQLSPITIHDKAQSNQARANANPAALARCVSTLRGEFPVQSVAAHQAEALIEWMGPSEVADRVRQQVISFVQRIISAHFPPTVAPLFFATGSYPMKTYLPGSDLDICLILPPEMETSWYYIVMQALCVAGSGGGAGTVLDLNNPGGSENVSGSTSPCAASAAVGRNGGSLVLTNTVRNVTFINADVRVIKCTIDNISVDITANRVSALGAVRLLDVMAARVGRHHLFKKSILLIKAWCTHESSGFMQAASAEADEASGLGSTPSSVTGASHGAFSTYAINTIVMALFIQHGKMLSHPLQALYMFLDQLAEFPWHESALTLHGAIPLSRLTTTSVHGTTLYTPELTTGGLDANDIEAIRDALADQFGALDSSHKGTSTSLFPIRSCNIVDPLDDKNNLARSVSAEVFPVLKRAFRLARDQLAAMLAPQSLHRIDDVELLCKDRKEEEVSKAFFARCWQLYGRGDGWRPDLLIHPRQTWHGKPATMSVKNSKMSPRHLAAAMNKSDEDEGSRWDSLLPSLDAGAVNALLLQYQQLQHQAAAAAAYHHSTMIAYQQPYYGPLPQHGHPMGSPSSTLKGSGVQTNGIPAEASPATTDQVSCDSTMVQQLYEKSQCHGSKSPPSENCWTTERHENGNRKTQSRRDIAAHVNKVQ